MRTRCWQWIYMIQMLRRAQRCPGTGPPRFRPQGVARIGKIATEWDAQKIYVSAASNNPTTTAKKKRTRLVAPTNTHDFGSMRACVRRSIDYRTRRRTHASPSSLFHIQFQLHASAQLNRSNVICSRSLCVSAAPLSIPPKTNDGATRFKARICVHMFIGACTRWRTNQPDVRSGLLGPPTRPSVCSPPGQIDCAFDQHTLWRRSHFPRERVCVFTSNRINCVGAWTPPWALRHSSQCGWDKSYCHRVAGLNVYWHACVFGTV